MKKIILGTLAAASVVASMGVASAQVRTERSLFDWSASSMNDSRTMQDPSGNFAPDYIK